jgi:hypothetical protein
MANASKHHIGPAAKGKRDGSGAMTELPEGVLEENMVLSNRDKSRHSDERGLDGKTIQTEQFQDHVGARRNFDQMGDQGPGSLGSDNASGQSAPMSDASGEDGSLKKQSE